MSERLAYLILHEFVLRNDIVLSMHGWSKEASLIPYVEYPDQASAVARKSRAAALALGLEFVHPYKWLPGQLACQAICHGVAAIEPEVGGMGTVTSEGQGIYRSIIYRFLGHLGMLEGKEKSLVPSCPDTRIIQHVDCLADSAGLLRSSVRLGAKVQKGDLLWRIYGLDGRCLERFYSPRTGTIGVLRTFASVQAGDRVAQIFWEVK